MHSIIMESVLEKREEKNQEWKKERPAGRELEPCSSQSVQDPLGESCKTVTVSLPRVQENPDF